MLSEGRPGGQLPAVYIGPLQGECMIIIYNPGLLDQLGTLLDQLGTLLGQLGTLLDQLGTLLDQLGTLQDHLSLFKSDSDHHRML